MLSHSRGIPTADREQFRSWTTAIVGADYTDLTGPEAEGMPEMKSQQELDVYIGKLESDMREAAKRFEFEKAAKLRDRIRELRTKEFLFA